MKRENFFGLIEQHQIESLTKLTAVTLWRTYLESRHYLKQYVLNCFDDTVRATILFAEAPPAPTPGESIKYMLNPNYHEHKARGRQYIKEIYKGLVAPKLPNSKTEILRDLGGAGFLLIDVFPFSIDYSRTNSRQGWYDELLVDLLYGAIEDTTSCVHSCGKDIDLGTSRYGFLLKGLGEKTIDILSSTEKTCRLTDWLQPRNVRDYDKLWKGVDKLSRYKLVVTDTSNYPSWRLIKDLN